MFACSHDCRLQISFFAQTVLLVSGRACDFSDAKPEVLFSFGTKIDAIQAGTPSSYALHSAIHAKKMSSQSIIDFECCMGAKEAVLAPVHVRARSTMKDQSSSSAHGALTEPTLVTVAAH
jgi:hypothetical protein